MYNFATLYFQPAALFPISLAMLIILCYTVKTAAEHSSCDLNSGHWCCLPYSPAAHTAKMQNHETGDGASTFGDRLLWHIMKLYLNGGELCLEVCLYGFVSAPHKSLLISLRFF